MHRFATLSCGLLLSASAAFAGPLNSEHVAAEARWIVHIDMQGFVNSSVGKCMIEHHGGEAMDGVEELNEALGIDVLHDVLGLTFYGTEGKGQMGVNIGDDEVRVGASAEEHELAVAVVVMTGAADEMIERIKQHESYAEVRKDGIVLHSFVDDESEARHLLFIQQGATPGERLIVAGHDIQRVAHAVNVVNRKAANLTNGDVLISNVKPHPGSLMFGVAVNFKGWGDEDPASQVLEKSRQIMIDFGERDGEAFTVVALAANTPEDASNISQILQGVIAFGRMALANEEDAEGLLHLLNSIKFQSHEENIVALVKVSADEACEMIKRAAEHHGHDFDDEHDDEEDDDHHHHHAD